jgi:hypothetical protein
MNRWDEYLDDKIDFDTFWGLRGKELEGRVITWESVVNDARTLTHEERMKIVQELAMITADTIEKVELFSLTNQQLKRLNTLLITSRGNLGDDDLKTFETIINKGVSQSLVASIIDQKIIGLPKKEFDILATFLLKPSRWVGDTLLGVTNQFLTNFEDLIDALGS